MIYFPTSWNSDLSPHQALLTEAQTVQQATDLKFCWEKQGSIFLSMTDTSRIHKLNNFQNLQSLQTGEE